MSYVNWTPIMHIYASNRLIIMAYIACGDRRLYQSLKRMKVTVTCGRLEDKFYSLMNYVKVSLRLIQNFCFVVRKSLSQHLCRPLATQRIVHRIHSTFRAFSISARRLFPKRSEILFIIIIIIIIILLLYTEQSSYATINRQTNF